MRRVQVQLIGKGGQDLEDGQLIRVKGELVQDRRRYVILKDENGFRVKIPWSRIQVIREIA